MELLEKKIYWLTFLLDTHFQILDDDSLFPNQIVDIIVYFQQATHVVLKLIENKKPNFQIYMKKLNFYLRKKYVVFFTSFRNEERSLNF